ncbi:MAG: hypothetical protein V4622_00180 [Bacteroidota bacterium]
MKNKSIVFNVIILVLLFQFIFSCNLKEKMLLEKNETENDWRILKLNLNNEKLWVILEEDSIFYSQIFRDDTSYFKENDRFRVVVKKSVIDSLTKENVFRISKE